VALGTAGGVLVSGGLTNRSIVSVVLPRVARATSSD